MSVTSSLCLINLLAVVLSFTFVLFLVHFSLSSEFWLWLCYFGILKTIVIFFLSWIYLVLILLC